MELLPKKSLHFKQTDKNTLNLQAEVVVLI